MTVCHIWQICLICQSYSIGQCSVSEALFPSFPMLDQLLDFVQFFNSFLLCRYNIVVSGQFGSLVDGQWNGIVGMVHKGVNIVTTCSGYKNKIVLCTILW